MPVDEACSCMAWQYVLLPEPAGPCQKFYEKTGRRRGVSRKRRHKHKTHYCAHHETCFFIKANSNLFSGTSHHDNLNGTSTHLSCVTLSTEKVEIRVAITQIEMLGPGRQVEGERERRFFLLTALFLVSSPPWPKDSARLSFGRKPIRDSNFNFQHTIDFFESFRGWFCFVVLRRGSSSRLAAMVHSD